MYDVYFDPVKSQTEASDQTIRGLLSLPGIHSADCLGVCTRDIGRASRQRWDVKLRIEEYRLDAVRRFCAEHKLGRLRFVGATWANPWEVTDPRILGRLREKQARRSRQERLSQTTRKRLSFA